MLSAAPPVDNVIGLAEQQQRAAIASDAAGNYVVAWAGARADDPDEINAEHTPQNLYAQRYNAAGEAQGDVILVGTLGVGHSNVRVVFARDGSFYIAADHNRDLAVCYEAMVQHYSADGQRLGDPLELEAAGFLQSFDIGPNGDLVATYYTGEVWVLTYDSAGERTSATRLGEGWEPQVAMADDGSFVVTWNDRAPRASGVVAQMFFADGTTRSDRIRLNWRSGESGSPAIAIDAGGGFLIAWDQVVNGEHRVFAERRDATGKALGAVFEVSESGFADATRPSVAIDADGSFFVTWDVLSPPVGDKYYVIPVPQPIGDPGPGSVWARAYDASGRALGSAFDIVGTDGIMGVAGTAIGRDGDLLVVWGHRYKFGQEFPRIIAASGHRQVFIFRTVTQELHVGRFALDLAGGHGTITAADFTFHLGERDRPGWSIAPPPISVTTLGGAGVGGSDRVTIVWADGAIENAWLQVTVLANGNTGLAGVDTFYFGNVVGEIGAGSFGVVTTHDALRTINHFQSAGDPSAGIDNLFDFNRDGAVTVKDIHTSITRIMSELPLLYAISPPNSANSASDYYGVTVYGLSGQMGLLPPFFEGVLELLPAPNSAPPAATAAAAQLWEDERFDPLADDDPAELVLPTESSP